MGFVLPVAAQGGKISAMPSLGQSTELSARVGILRIKKTAATVFTQSHGIIIGIAA